VDLLRLAVLKWFFEVRFMVELVDLGTLGNLRTQQNLGTLGTQENLRIPGTQEN
jgi:hypothetical protein